MSPKYSWFLPFEKYTIQTTLSEEEAIERIRIITRTINTIQFSPRTAALLRANFDYNGEVLGKSFEVWRSINYLNSFLPIIQGTVSSYLDKTHIRVSMNMSFFIKTITIIGLTIAFIGTLVSFILYPINFKTFIPVIGIIFSYLVIFLCFKLEARKSKNDLNRIFKAEPEWTPYILQNSIFEQE